MNNIAKFRKEKGLSQFQLAEMLGVTQQTISKYENDDREPDVTTIVKLINIFNTSFESIFGLTNNCIKEEEVNYSVNKTDYIFQKRFNDICSNLTVEDISKITNLSLETLYKIKQFYMPTLDELRSISKGFNISLDYLLGMDNKIDNISKEETEILSYYKKLHRDDQLWIIGQMVDIYKHYNNSEL